MSNKILLAMMFIKDTLASARAPELKEPGSTLEFSARAVSFSSGFYKLPPPPTHTLPSGLKRHILSGALPDHST